MLSTVRDPRWLAQRTNIYISWDFSILWLLPRCTDCINVVGILFKIGWRAFLYTEYTQKNYAVSKAKKKFISHLTRAQHTPSAAATVQVSHALPAVRFSCLLRG